MKTNKIRPKFHFFDKNKNDSPRFCFVITVALLLEQFGSRLIRDSKSQNKTTRWVIYIPIFVKKWNLRRILLIFIHSLIKSKSNELPQSLGGLCSHIEHRTRALAERVWWTKPQSLLLNIYFHISGFQSSLLLIHFRYGPNTCSNFTTGCHRTYSRCDAPFSRSARRSSIRCRKRAKIIFRMCGQKPCLVWFSCRRMSHPVWCQHSVSSHSRLPVLRARGGGGTLGIYGWGCAAGTRET